MMTNNFKKQRTAQQMMDDNLIVKHLAGSHAYGTNTPTSDVDYRGVFVADALNIRTPFFPVYEVDDGREEDTKIYELSKFLHLVVDNNPNVVETLWVDESDITFSTPAYQLLRENAHRFLSKKIAFTTSGYAFAQLKRIKGHNKWISNPQPKEKPQPVDFVSMIQHFPSEGTLPLMPRDFNLRQLENDWRLVPFGKDTFGLYYRVGYTSFNKNSGSLNTDFQNESRASLGAPTFIVKFNQEEYESAKVRWEQYWTWKNNRNEARSELEEKFGYDTKHAMHLVRLLRMGKEALTEGKIYVKRPDAQELLEIRNGKWEYEQIVEYAEKLDKEIKEIYLPASKLPKEADKTFAANLILNVQDLVWNKN